MLRCTEFSRAFDTTGGACSPTGLSHAREMRHNGTSKKPLEEGESLKQRAISDLEPIKNDKPLSRSLFHARTLFYAAA